MEFDILSKMEYDTYDFCEGCENDIVYIVRSIWNDYVSDM